MATYLKGDEIEFKANKRLLNAPEKSKELDPAKEGQFTIKSKTMEQYVFEPVWNDIKECVDQTIKAPNMPVIDHIYLVGGLSKSHQLHRLFQDNFKHVKIHSQVFAEFLSTESLANSGALYCAYTIFNEFSSVPQLVDKLNFRDDNFQRIYTHYG
jgi:hypothetical protein